MRGEVRFEGIEDGVKGVKTGPGKDPPRERTRPRRLPRPSRRIANRGDSTPVELDVEGIRAWEHGMRALLAVKR